MCACLRAHHYAAQLTKPPASSSRLSVPLRRAPRAGWSNALVGVLLPVESAWLDDFSLIHFPLFVCVAHFWEMERGYTTDWDTIPPERGHHLGRLQGANQHTKTTSNKQQKKGSATRFCALTRCAAHAPVLPRPSPLPCPPAEKCSVSVSMCVSL